MDNKNSVVFYRSFWDAGKELPAEQRLEFYEAILEYGLNGTEPKLSPMMKAMFRLVEPLLDRNYSLYENGKKGGAPKGNRNALKQPKTTKNNQKQASPSNNEVEVEVDKEVDIEVEGEVEVEVEGEGCFTTATRPTLEDISFYFDEIGSTADPERFYDYYGAEALSNMDWQSKADEWKRTQYSRKSKEDDWEKELEEWAKS